MATTVCGFIQLPHRSTYSWYLTEEDKELMAIRYRQNAIYNGNQSFEWSKVYASVTDVKLYLNGFAQLCANVASFGFATFLPSEQQFILQPWRRPFFPARCGDTVD